MDISFRDVVCSGGCGVMIRVVSSASKGYCLMCGLSANAKNKIQESVTMSETTVQAEVKTEPVVEVKTKKVRPAINQSPIINSMLLEGKNKDEIVKAVVEKDPTTDVAKLIRHIYVRRSVLKKDGKLK